jgi:hypothetical protein
MSKRMKIVVLGLAVCGAIAAYAAFVKCPIDGLNMTWTGKTRTEMGRLLNEHKCPNGHVSWIVQ